MKTYGVRMGMTFQVTDVKKPLMSVKRIVEKGNYVVFGPNPEDNYIENRDYGDRVMLRREGGSFLMDAKFVGGGMTKITIDSGAEENVCPKEWGEMFELKEPERKQTFRNASGGKIEHYGCRDVLLLSPF